MKRALRSCPKSQLYEWFFPCDDIWWCDFFFKIGALPTTICNLHKRAARGGHDFRLTAEVLDYSFTRAVSGRGHVERTSLVFTAVESQLGERQVRSHLIHGSYSFCNFYVRTIWSLLCRVASAQQKSHMSPPSRRWCDKWKNRRKKKPKNSTCWTFCDKVQACRVACAMVATHAIFIARWRHNIFKKSQAKNRSCSRGFTAVQLHKV